MLQINPDIAIMATLERSALDEKQQELSGRQPVTAILCGVCAVFCKIHPGHERARHSYRRRYGTKRTAARRQQSQHGDECRRAGPICEIHLGPAFQTAGINTKIVIWDHNCDNPQYPISILNDANARRFVHGSAFHLYNGDISALSTVQQAHPDKKLYFTEQWTGANGTFRGDFLLAHQKCGHRQLAQLVGERTGMEFGQRPRFQAAHAGRLYPVQGRTHHQRQYRESECGVLHHRAGIGVCAAWLVRIQSEGAERLHHVAFKRADGKKVMIVLNEGAGTELFKHPVQRQKGIDLFAGRIGGYFCVVRGNSDVPIKRPCL